MIPIIPVIATENRAYKRGERITPNGIVVHSTAANNTQLRRYVQPDPDGTIGKNQSGNHWNQAKADKCMHGFIGTRLDGSLAFAQTLPWEYRCWGCGGAESGSYNDTHIQFEVCEDALDDPEYYWAAFGAAAEICAMLCRQYGIKTRRIVSHKEAAAALYASGHVDPEHWMDNFGDSMDAFRARVAALIGEDTTVRPTWQEMRRDTIRIGARSTDVAEMQGIINALGYNAGKVDGIFGKATQKAVKAYQAATELTPDGVAGPRTWQAALADIFALEGRQDEPVETPADKPWASMTTEEKVEDLNERLMAVEGGDTHG